MDGDSEGTGENFIWSDTDIQLSERGPDSQNGGEREREMRNVIEGLGK